MPVVVEREPVAVLADDRVVVGDAAGVARRAWLTMWWYSPCTGTNQSGSVRLSMNLSSSCDAWPDTCTGASPPWMTSAPARHSASMTRVTFASLPGIACAEITTTSSSLIFTYLCSCAAMSDSALSGSPCEPVQMMHTSPGGSLAASAMSITRFDGTSSRPISRASVTLLTIERPRNAILRPAPSAASATCRTRCRCDAKLATMNRRSGWSRNTVRIAAPTVDSDGVYPGRSALVESDRSSREPRRRARRDLAEQREVGACGRRPGVRSSLKSPVCRIVPAGVWNAIANACGTECVTGMNSQSNGPIWTPLAVVDRDQLRPADQPGLLDAVPGQPERERRAVDRAPRGRGGGTRARRRGPRGRG